MKNRSLAFAAFESVPEALLIADHDGMVVFANRHAERMFGYEPGQFVGHEIDALVSKRSRHRHADLRAKFAVLSTADFSHAVGPRCLHSYILARFAQPALLVYARADSARDAAISGADQAVLTLASQPPPPLPA